MAPTRVLVVEDEALIRMMMVEVLTEAGFDVDEAADSDEAERLLDEDGYKLLVTDIHMPGSSDGVQLAERLHRAEPGIPILFVTARPDVLGRIRAAGIEATTLVKPYDPESLVPIVRGILQRHDGCAGG
jgi:two-component system, response regulator PdtaR